MPKILEALTSLLSRGQRRAEPLPVLDLPAYQHLLRDTPLPSPAQRDRFVDYVAHAHSWYKHLPHVPPGEPFTFYLDPLAGCDLVATGDGRVTAHPRSTGGMHYSALATADYLAQFGHLNFAHARGTLLRMVRPGQPGVRREQGRRAAIADESGAVCGLPPCVVRAGMVDLTSLIHVATAASPDPSHWQGWPEVAGGQRAVQAIRARLQQLQQGAPFEPLEQTPLLPWAARECGGVDRQIDAWYALERRRLHGDMRAAIDRVCARVTAATA